MRRRVSIALLVLLLAAAAASWAGGPLKVDSNGEPMYWPTGSATSIPYAPDRGSLGQLGNAAARTLVAQAFDVWAAASVVSFEDPLRFTEDPLLPEDVDASSFLRYVFCTAGQPCRTDGLSPIVFDTDGSIIDAMLGPGARYSVFGLGGVQTEPGANGQITEAAFVINGAFYDGIGLPSSPADLDLEAFKAVLVHEIGHFLNLDHSALNAELAGDGDPDNDVFLPSMFAFSSDDDAALATLNPDDVAALRTIHIGGTFSRIEGRVQVESPELSETLYFQGANVVLRKTDDPLMTAYSMVSGAWFDPCVSGGTCDPCSASCTSNVPAQGEFHVAYIAPGNYTVCVEQLDTRLAVGPRDRDHDGALDDARAIVPGPEECWDLGESPLAAADDPDDATPVDSDSMPYLVLQLDDLPLSDPFEPNNTRITASTLADLPSGRDTVGAVLAAGDVDHYAISVIAGDRLRVDVDAAEVGYLQGSIFDAVIGLYDPSGALVVLGGGLLVDDAVDPDSAAASTDPAFEITVAFTGTAVLVVSSYPDLDFDGIGGHTIGPYWLRVVVDRDSDGDGTVDRLDRCPTDPLDDVDDDGACASTDTCLGHADPDGDGVPGPCIVEAGWVLTRTIDFTDPAAARYNPIDGRIYVARRGDTGEGLYRIENNGTALFMWDSAHYVASLLVDPTDGDIFASDGGGATILRTVPTNPGPNGSDWVDGLGAGAEHLVGMAIAPPGYGGSVLSPNEALVVDLNGVLWRWSPAAAQGEALAYADTGLVEPIDVAIDDATVWVAATGGEDGGAIWGVDTGPPVELLTSEPIEEPRAIAVDRSTGDLLVLDVMSRRLLRIDPTTGDVTTLIDQLDLSAADEWAGLDVAQSGGILVVTDRAADRIYVLERDRDGDGVVDGADSCTSSVNPLQADTDGDGFGDACDTCPLAANPEQRYRVDTTSLAPGEIVGTPLISPDRSRVVFIADKTPGVFELYSAPLLTGGPPVKLNGPLVAGGNVSTTSGSVVISSDSQRVAYVADQDTDGVFELYSVPIGGGTPVKLSGLMVAGGDVSGPLAPAFSSRLVYRADQDTNDVFELYSVPYSGGTPIKLNGPGVSVLDNTNSYTNLGAMVVFVAVAGNVTNLYSVPITGGTPTQLNAASPPGEGVVFPFTTPGGQVLYTAVQDSPGVIELYSVPITGGTPVKLNAPLVSGGDVDPFNFTWAVDNGSHRVVYRADQDTDGVVELYSVSTFGGPVVKLNGPLQNDGSDVAFRIWGDGARVVYGAQQDTAGMRELYEVPITGGTRVKLNSPLVAGGDVSDWTIVSGGAIYSADQETDGVVELYRGVTGGTPVKLSHALAAGESVADHSFALDSASDSPWVVYTVEQETTGRTELYSVRVAGGVPVKLNGAVLGAGVASFQINVTFQMNGTLVLYIADEDTDGFEREIHAVFLYDDRDADGSADTCDRCPFAPDPLQADRDGDGFGDVCDVCPDEVEQVSLGQSVDARTVIDTHVFFVNPFSRTLHAAPTEGGSEQLSDFGHRVFAFLVAPDGSRVVYLADQGLNTVSKVYSVELGVEGVVELSGPLVAGGNVVSLSRIAPDSSRVIYRADASTDNVVELYSVPIAGAALPVRLSGPMTTGGDVVAATVSPTSSRVVYYADQDTDQLGELYSVPIAGGTAVKLSGTLVAGGQLSDPAYGLDPLPDWLFFANGSRVVYRADQDTDEVHELYSVPVDGGTPMKLNGPLVSGGDVATGPPLYTPNGSRVIYRADQDADEVLELYSRRVQGGGPPAVKLNGALVAGGDVGALAIAPNGSRVVYLADQDADEVVELFSVPIFGGGAIKLNGTLVPGGDVTDRSIAPDSSRVVYGADQDTDEVRELYSVPLGGGGVVKLNGPLPAGVSVSNHTVAPDSSYVVYQAFDLYRVPLAGGARVRLTSGGVHSYELTPDFSRVYWGDMDETEQADLITARLDDDVDADGTLDYCDVCPSAGDPGQTDGDGDGIGDLCDNCPLVPNPSQQPCPPDTTSPTVLGVVPKNGFLDAPLATRVLLFLSERIDSASATSSSFFLEIGGVKVPGSVRVGANGRWLEFDPAGTLAPNADYSVRLTNDVTDLAGNPAVPFSSTFDTVGGAGLGGLPADLIGRLIAGAPIPGRNAGDHAGFSVAALGDVNGDGTADLLIGGPDADPNGAIDAGSAMLVFGETGLQSDAAAAHVLEYLGENDGDRAGWTVGRAGDLNGDGRADLLIGAPFADVGADEDAGRVYVVFGHDGLDELAGGSLDLAALTDCSAPTLCGVVFEGAAPFDLAGTAVTFAGDLDGDLDDDLLIGAPGASAGAGKVYVIHGPLPGPAVVALRRVDLATVGSTTPGLVLEGEEPGDGAGAALSAWVDNGVNGSDGHDDLLIGAPGASVFDPWGGEISGAGVVYAVRGGTANLDDKANAGVIELSRTPHDVLAFLFLGTLENTRLGGSLTGGIDSDGDGQPDIYIGGTGQVLFVSGNGPKTITDNSNASRTGGADVSRRQLGPGIPITSLGAVFYEPGLDGTPGPLVVGPAGDVSDDGIDDLVIGAPGADPPGPGADAGKAYIVYGSTVTSASVVRLSDVGVEVPGLALEGRDPSDHLGQSVSGGFDLNADGIDDALVGAPFADPLVVPTADARGESYVVSPVQPDEVALLNLARAGASARLEWTVPHRALGYHVYRGLLSALRTAGVVRTSNVVPAFACGLDRDGEIAGLPPDTSDAAIPPPGAAYVYLVTASNFFGEGPLGPPGAEHVHDGQCP